MSSWDDTLNLISCFTKATEDVHVIDLCMMEDVCYLTQRRKTHLYKSLFLKY